MIPQAWMEYARLQWMTHWAAWAIFVGSLLLTWIVAVIAGRIMKGIIFRLTSRTNTTLDDKLAQATAGPMRFLVGSIGLTLSLNALGQRIPSFRDPALLQTEFGYVVQAAGALVILAVTAMVNAAFKTGLDWYVHEKATGNQATWDRELLPVVRRVVSLLLYFIAISIILENFGQDITALVTTAGVASLAVALAAQDTLANMIGGFVILVDRPFKVGDVIELADSKMGEVVEIGLRSTKIKQFDGNALVIPNKDMANSRIVNYALPNQQAAIRQTLGLDYGTDMEKAKQVLLGVLTSHPEVLKEPEPGVWFTKFGASSLDLFMSCWVASYKDRFRITDELNLRILQAFRGAGLVIAYPQQDVHLYLEDQAARTEAVPKLTDQA